MLASLITGLILLGLFFGLCFIIGTIRNARTRRNL